MKRSVYERDESSHAMQKLYHVGSRCTFGDTAAVKSMKSMPTPPMILSVR